MLCQNSQWEDFWCHPSMLLCPKSKWEDSCVTNQRAVLSELPKGQFSVPNHVRIPNGLMLCAKPCQNSNWCDSVLNSVRIPNGVILCAKPAHRFVRITNGVILCAKPCQNSQWIVHTVHTELDQNISSVAKPIALHQTIGRFSFLDSIGLGHILEF